MCIGFDTFVAFMGKRNKEQLNTTYTYIPSHIEEKTARYTALGGRPLTQWRDKLKALKEWHGADFQNLAAGNIVADSLATEARTSPTITYYRDASTSLDNVALTNKQGGLTEAGLKKIIEHTENQNNACVDPEESI